MRSARIASTATAAGLRFARCLAGLGGAGCGDGVDRIRLAVAASQLAVGAVHLDDRYILRVQVASQAGPVGACPFDAGPLD